MNTKDSGANRTCMGFFCKQSQMQPCPVLRLSVTQQWKRNGTTHFTFSQRVGPKSIARFPYRARIHLKHTM